MGIGWALTENFVHDAEGRVVNPALRNYRIPAFADIPRSEVFFADTYDKIGTLGAKSQGECAINAVAPAIANALKTATGVRFTSLPFTAARISSQLANGPQPANRMQLANEVELANGAQLAVDPVPLASR
jgi:putative selenate reductase molybdopterin-binding subunit